MTLAFRVTGESDRERRAYRKLVLEHLAASDAQPADSSAASIAEGARLLLESVELGDAELFGYPRDRINFERAYRMLGAADENTN